MIYRTNAESNDRVDGVVLAVAERLRAEAIATLDLRHFGVLDLPFQLYPRDL